MNHCHIEAIIKNSIPGIYICILANHGNIWVLVNYSHIEAIIVHKEIQGSEQDQVEFVPQGPAMLTHQFTMRTGFILFYERKREEEDLCHYESFNLTILIFFKDRQSHISSF